MAPKFSKTVVCVSTVCVLTCAILVAVFFTQKNNMLNWFRSKQLISFYLRNDYQNFLSWHKKYFPNTTDRTILRYLHNVHLKMWNIKEAKNALYHIPAQQSKPEDIYDLAMLSQLLGYYDNAKEILSNIIVQKTEPAEFEGDFPYLEVAKAYITLTEGDELTGLAQLKGLEKRVEPLQINNRVEVGFFKNVTGICLYRLGYLDEARKEFEHSINCVPTAASSHMFLALTHASLNDIEKARYNYAIAKSINPQIERQGIVGNLINETHKENVNLCIANCLLLNDVDNLQSCVNMLRDLSSPSIRVYYLNGLVAEGKGNREKALNNYSLAVNLRSDNLASSSTDPLSSDDYYFLSLFRRNVLEKRDLLDGIRDECNVVFENRQGNLQALWGASHYFEFSIVPDKSTVKIGILASSSVRSGIGSLLLVGLKNTENYYAYVEDKNIYLKLFNIRCEPNTNNILRVKLGNDVIRYIDTAETEEDRNLYLHKVFVLN